ncbi:MAG: protease modulator HflC [Syntrophobacteraceae bacterium]|nr:protease modulator HflC [Syntrophobacteraceae bacterium]
MGNTLIPRWVKLAAAALVVLVVVAWSCLFVVTETEQVVVTEFGRPVGNPITAAGLHFKLPFIETANYFDKRIMAWDGRPDQIATSDKKYIWVDTTARWQISNPLLFMERVGSFQTAQSRLDGIIDSVVRDNISDNDLVEIVRSKGWEKAKAQFLQSGVPGPTMGYEKPSDNYHLLKGREKITRDMVAGASKLISEFGMKLLDIRITRINYVESVRNSVYQRMISERKRIAAQYRSEGLGEKAAILGQMELQLAKLRSQAYKNSQEIRGKADAQATKIFAYAYSQDPEFFSLYKTLNLYGDFNKNSSFLLSTDSDVFKYLKGAGKQPSAKNLTTR